MLCSLSVAAGNHLFMCKRGSCRAHGCLLSAACPICPAHRHVRLPCAADERGQYVLDSVRWVAPNSMVASALWYDAGCDCESDDAYQLAITWSSWAGSEHAAPAGLQASQISFMALPVSTQHTGVAIAVLVITKLPDMRCI
jgi:hypothetical protein